MLREVRASESNPPLYYVLAWGWSKLFGTGEAGLRSLSALFGAATIPLAYLIGKDLLSRRAGLITAALVALNPMLIWYSQEARSYALLVLLCAASLLFFLRARRSGEAWDLAAVVAVLGAGAVEPLFRRLSGRDRGRLAAGRDQAPTRGPDGRRGDRGDGSAADPAGPRPGQPPPHRLDLQQPAADRALDTAASFMIGETGQVIGHKPRNGYAMVPGADRPARARAGNAGGRASGETGGGRRSHCRRRNSAARRRRGVRRQGLRNRPQPAARAGSPARGRRCRSRRSPPAPRRARARDRSLRLLARLRRPCRPDPKPAAARLARPCRQDRHLRARPRRRQPGSSPPTRSSSTSATTCSVSYSGRVRAREIDVVAKPFAPARSLGYRPTSTGSAG